MKSCLKRNFHYNEFTPKKPPFLYFLKNWLRCKNGNAKIVPLLISKSEFNGWCINSSNEKTFYSTHSIFTVPICTVGQKKKKTYLF